MLSNVKVKILFFGLIFSGIFLVACASELDQYIDACKKEFPSYAESMNRNVAEWEDAITIASATSRISLSGPVGELQSIRRDADRAAIPDCMTDTHQRYLEGMDTFIGFFLEFMADADAEPDEMSMLIAQYQILDMALKLEEYEDDSESFFANIRELAVTATAEAPEQ